MELFKLLGTISISGADTAKKDIDNVSGKAGNLGDTLTSVGGKISGFGGKLTAGLSVPLTALGTITVKAAADVKAANSQFEQTFGDLQTTAKDSISGVAKNAGILDTRLQGIGTSIYAFAKASGADSTEAMGLMETALQATADAAAYYDRSLDDTGESLMSFLKGNYANDAALGVSCTETTRNAAAMELFGEKFNDLSEIQKQQTLLKMVTDAQELSGAMGQASRESDGFENVTGNLKESAKLLSAEFGEVLLPKVVELMQKATEMLQKFKSMDDGTKKLILTVGGIAIAIGPVLTVFGSLATGVGKFINIATKVGPLLAGISAPVAITIAAIGALIAIGVTLYKNWDKIKAKATELKNNLKTTFTNIKDTITKIMNAIWSKITTVWENIKISISTKLEAIRTTISKKIKSAKDTIATVFESIRSTISNKINSAKTTVTTVFENIKSTISTKIKAAKETVASVFESIKTTIKSKIDAAKTTVTTIFESIKTTIKTKVNAAKSTVSTVFESIKTTIKTKINSTKSTVATVFESVRSTIKSKIDAAKSAVKSAIDAIKGFFNFEFKWPKLSLPRFSISPKGWKLKDLLEGTVPKLGIEWYAKGGVLNEPTAFGINGSKLMVGGEAGPEAVAPIETLQKYISEAVAAQNASLVDVLQKILAAILSNNEEMKDKFMEALEEMRFDINNREFARLVKAVN